MSDQQIFQIADGIGDAKSLIYATWLRSYHSASLRTKTIPKDTFFREHHKVIDRILDRPETKVRLAVMPDDPSVVFGWAVTEGPDVVHYVYVKPSFRKYGIARALLSGISAPFTYTHETFVLRDLYPRLEGCGFNPYGV